MAENACKTTWGYTVLPFHIDGTHIVMSKEEYLQMDREKQNILWENRNLKFRIDRFASKISQQEQALKQAEQREKAQTKNLQDVEERERQLAERERELNKQLENTKCELAQAQREINYWKGLNDNLLRISRERANAKRGLTPKKNHSGFQVIRSEERKMRYSSGGKNGNTDLRETFIQTPYSTDLREEYIRELLKVEVGNLSQRLGIKEPPKDDDKSNHTALNVQKSKDKGNGILQWTLHANYKLGYWELHILHTEPIGVVPEDMRPSAKSGRK